MIRFLMFLLLTAQLAGAQITLGGGMSSSHGGAKFGISFNPGDPFAACTLSPAQLAGRTEITACGNYPGGSYYLSKSLDAAGTCIATTNSTPFDLAMQGFTITYGNDPADFTQTLTNQVVTTSANSVTKLPRPSGPSTDGDFAVVTSISNTIACDTDANGSYETTYMKDTNYAIGYEHLHGKYANNADNGHGIVWLSGKPADGTACQVPSYTVSYPRYGIFNSNSNTYIRNTGNFANGGSGLKVDCGTITAAATAPPFSMPIWNAAKSAPTITNLHLNSKGWAAPGIGLSYTAGGTFANLVVNQLDTSGGVFWRDLYQGFGVWNYNRQDTPPDPNDFHDIEIINGYHGGLLAYQTGSTVHNNNIHDLRSKFTNDFGITLFGAGGSIYNNTVDCYDPSDPDVSCRGILVEASSATVYGNTVEVQEGTNNNEYGGCQAGGAYGAQVEHNTSAGEMHDNVFTAYAWNCDANGLRMSGGTAATQTTMVSHNETISALRKDNTVTARAVGLDTRGVNGWELRDSTVTGDSCIIGDVSQDSGDPATLATFRRVTLTKGPNPDASFHTWCPANFQPSSGDTVLDWYCVDCAVAGGAVIDDVDALPIGTSSRKGYNLWIEWSRTFNVKVGGVNTSGFLVKATDTAGGTYQGTTDAQGNVTLELPQYHIFNTAGAGVNEAVLNPYSIAITKTGCTAVSLTNQSYSASGTTNITTTCP